MGKAGAGAPPRRRGERAAPAAAAPPLRLEWLPADALREIIAHLSVTERRRLCLSKALAAAVRAERCSGHGTANCPQSLDEATAFLARHGNLRALDLVIEREPLDLRRLVDRAARVTRLELGGALGAGAALRHIAGGFQALRELCLAQAEDSAGLGRRRRDGLEALAALSALTALTMMKCTGDAGLGEFVHLRELHLGLVDHNDFAVCCPHCGNVHDEEEVRARARLRAAAAARVRVGAEIARLPRLEVCEIDFRGGDDSGAAGVNAARNCFVAAAAPGQLFFQSLKSLSLVNLGDSADYIPNAATSGGCAREWRRPGALTRLFAAVPTLQRAAARWKDPRGLEDTEPGEERVAIPGGGGALVVRVRERCLNDPDEWEVEEQLPRHPVL
jgi:hypothetical protein